MPGDDPYGHIWDTETVSDAMKLIVLSDDEEFFESSGRQAAERILGLVPMEDAVVMDLGCGIGRVARFVAPQCREMWLADISPRMLEMAGQRLAAHPNIHLVQATARGVPDVADASVDVVYSVLVLQHVEREDAYCILRDLVRVLRPGGTAFLTFPNLLHDGYLESFVHYAETGEVSNPARARFYTPPEVERLMGAAGFVDVRIVDEPDIIVIARRAG